MLTRRRTRMSSSLSTLGLMALFLFLSEMASAIQVPRKEDNRVFIHQRPSLQQRMDLQISPRIPDNSFTEEDSYIVALRESQRDRNKVFSAPAIDHHHHHHTESHHESPSSFVDDANEQFNGQQLHLIQVPTTYGYVSIRPLTAMEKNYLRPHRPQPTEPAATHHGITHLEDIHQTEDDESEKEASEEEVMETSASKEVVNLAPRPIFSDSDANSIYSAYSSNTASVINNQPPPSIKNTASDVNSIYSAYTNTARDNVNINNATKNTVRVIVNKKPPSIKKTIADVNSMYSAFSSNTTPVVINNKPPPIKKTPETNNKNTTVKTNENHSKKPQEIQKPIKKTQLIRVPDVVGVMTNRAASVVRNGIKTVGSTIGIPMRNTLVETVNTAMSPLVAVLSVGRKKRSLASEQKKKSWKNNIEKVGVRTLGYVELLAKLMNKPLQSAVNINKLSNTRKWPLWSHFTRSTNSQSDFISNNNATEAHSTVKRSTNSKIKHLKANTNLKHMIPWLYSALSRNKNRKMESRTLTDVDIIEEKDNFLDENEVNDESLTSPLVEDSPLLEHDGGDQLKENELSGEEENNENENTLKRESSSEFPDSFENQSEEIDQFAEEEENEQQDTADLTKYTHGHGIIVPPEKVYNSDETLKYTHGHGIIVPNPPYSGDSSSLVSNSVDKENILNSFLNSNFSSTVSNDGLYITTGIFQDEVDMALDDLESLMSDVFIAPLPGQPGVEAVVAEENDAVIIESLEDANKPDSVPVVSNLANIFLASSGSTSSSSSSSSSSESVATSTTGLTIDPFATLYTIGLAAIGIFVLSLPIWVPIVAAQMKKKWNNSVYYRRQTLDRFKELNPVSILMRNLILKAFSEEAFSDPGPLSSEEVYGPAITNFGDRRRRRRSTSGKTFQHKKR